MHNLSFSPFLITLLGTHLLTHRDHTYAPTITQASIRPQFSQGPEHDVESLYVMIPSDTLPRRAPIG